MARRFYLQHPVFTAEEFQAHLRAKGAMSPSTRNTLLARRLKAGDLVRVRRGLYAVVPAGATAETAAVDAYLLASRMTADAVLAYHTALEFHGRAHSLFEVFHYLTHHAARPAVFRSHRFEAVLTPRLLRNKPDELLGVQSRERSGLTVRVTSLERTMVDILDRPDLGGGWEEIWRSLESVEFFDLDLVVRYGLLLGNATTIAKVGFFLQQHRDRLMVTDEHLADLKAHRPKQPRYWDRTHRGDGRFLADWNLVVPTALIEKSWSDVL